MNRITRMDGNVVHAQFGANPRASQPMLSVSCELLYFDDLVAVSRLTYRLGDQVLVQHVVTEAQAV